MAYRSHRGRLASQKSGCLPYRFWRRPYVPDSKKFPKNKMCDSHAAICDMSAGAVSVCVLQYCHELAAESMPHNMRGNMIVHFSYTLLEDRADDSVSGFPGNRSSLWSG